MALTANELPIWDKSKPLPTLGHEAAEWIEGYCVHGPGDVRGEPVTVTDDFYRFLCRALIVHPVAICGDPDCHCEDMVGRFVRRINVLSRLKGYAKTEDIAWILHWKLSGLCLPNGWDEEGNPIASMANSPYIPIAATSDEQAEDTLWGCFQAIALEAPNLSHLEVQKREVVNPFNRGLAKQVNSSSSRNDGGKPTAIGIDEAHLLHGQELMDLGKVLERNLAKRNVGQPQMFVATTMFQVGQGSYAESLWDRSEKDPQILYDHCQASDHWNTDDDEQLRSAIKEAAGDAIGWLNVRQLMSSYRADPSEGERYWLNRYGGGTNAKLVNIHAMRECPKAPELKSNDIVALGIDGSMYNDNSGVVVCRLSDLSLHYLWHYEPDGTEEDAMAMAMGMDDAVQTAMDALSVTRIYADPPYITEYISKWSNLAARQKSKFKTQVVSWWTNRSVAMSNATRELVTAINLSNQPHDHSPLLMDHFANAYKKETTNTIMVGDVMMNGYVPRKQTPKSVKKVDLAVCAILARQAAVDSIAAGEDKKMKRYPSGMVSY
jgi:hypothetical protein